MKNLKTILAFLITLFATFHPKAQSTDSLNSKKLFQEFQKQTEKWKDAYNSKNAQNLVLLYSEDARY